MTSEKTRQSSDKKVSDAKARTRKALPKSKALKNTQGMQKPVGGTNAAAAVEGTYYCSFKTACNR